MINKSCYMTHRPIIFETNVIIQGGRTVHVEMLCNPLMSARAMVSEVLQQIVYCPYE